MKTALNPVTYGAAALARPTGPGLECRALFYRFATIGGTQTLQTFDRTIFLGGGDSIPAIDTRLEAAYTYGVIQDEDVTFDIQDNDRTLYNFLRDYSRDANGTNEYGKLFVALFIHYTGDAGMREPHFVGRVMTGEIELEASSVQRIRARSLSQVYGEQPTSDYVAAAVGNQHLGRVLGAAAQVMGGPNAQESSEIVIDPWLETQNYVSSLRDSSAATTSSGFVFLGYYAPDDEMGFAELDLNGRTGTIREYRFKRTSLTLVHTGVIGSWYCQSGYTAYGKIWASRNYLVIAEGSHLDSSAADKVYWVSFKVYPILDGAIPQGSGRDFSDPIALSGGIVTKYPKLHQTDFAIEYNELCGYAYSLTGNFTFASVTCAEIIAGTAVWHNQINGIGAQGKPLLCYDYSGLAWVTFPTNLGGPFYVMESCKRTGANTWIHDAYSGQVTPDFSDNYYLYAHSGRRAYSSASTYYFDVSDLAQHQYLLTLSHVQSTRDPVSGQYQITCCVTAGATSTYLATIGLDGSFTNHCTLAIADYCWFVPFNRWFYKGRSDLEFLGSGVAGNAFVLVSNRVEPTIDMSAADLTQSFRSFLNLCCQIARAFCRFRVQSPQFMLPPYTYIGRFDFWTRGTTNQAYVPESRCARERKTLLAQQVSANVKRRQAPFYQVTVTKAAGVSATSPGAYTPIAAERLEALDLTNAIATTGQLQLVADFIAALFYYLPDDSPSGVWQAREYHEFDVDGYTEADTGDALCYPVGEFDNNDVWLLHWFQGYIENVSNNGQRMTLQTAVRQE
jgi:hypothetical protein